MKHSWDWCRQDKPVFVDGRNTDITLHQSLRILQHDSGWDIFYGFPTLPKLLDNTVDTKIKHQESQGGRIWHHWVRAMIELNLKDLLDTPFLSGTEKDETRQHLFYAPPIQKLAQNVYFSLSDHEGNQVFDGSALEFMGGLLCHTPQKSERFFLDEKTLYNTLIAKAGRSALTHEAIPGARLEKLWQAIRPHQQHLMTAFKQPPSEYNLLDNSKPLWQVGIVMPYMFYYSQCAKQALSDKGFLSWLSDPYGAKQYGGGKIIEHILLGDMSFQEKKQTIQILKKHVDKETLGQWFQDIDHVACFKRGVMKSWINTASLLGQDPEQVFNRMPDKTWLGGCLEDKAHHLSSWLPYIELFCKADNHIDHIIKHEMCAHYIIQAQRIITLRKNSPQESEKSSMGWMKLQQAGLAPQKISFEQAISLLKNERVQFEKEGGWEDDSEHPDIVFVRNFQKYWFKEQLQKELATNDKPLANTHPRKRM